MRTLARRVTTLVVPAMLSLMPAARAQWSPADVPISTRWKVDPANPHPEYPRPLMERSEWANLNGLWEYAVTPRAEATSARAPVPPSEWNGTILVPFAIESSLSGVGRRVGADETLWYRRTITIPTSWRDRQVLLNFGAVDWESQVYVNGTPGPIHRGGYASFGEDITSRLRLDRADQEIVVRAWDPTDAGTQPRGKQVREPGGIWYTPTTGIWQTVWMEPVVARRIMGMRITPDLADSSVRFEVIGPPYPVTEAIVSVFEGDRQIESTRGRCDRPIVVRMPGARRWSPDSPFLYRAEVTLLDGGKARDKVKTYFGMREVSLGRDDAARTRVMLNGEPLFLLGTLDQGFWPDGIYTPASDAALKHDLEVLKDLGFNAVRKHVKVELPRFYYWCDVLGLAVMQDMPSGDAYAPADGSEIERTATSARDFENELRTMIGQLGNHPSVVAWVPFNEGWGQYDTARITRMVKDLDPTRLVACASGWNDFPVGDIHDIHAYPGPAAPPLHEDRAGVLGEFGGLGLVVDGHTWKTDGSWGYQSFKDSALLTDAYVRLLDGVRRLHHERGLSAAIYTQTSDVEIEVNGLMTYDREVLKLDRDRARAANLAVHRPPPARRAVVPAADREPATWRWTTTQPAEGWESPGFDDSGWKEGRSGFGTAGTPGAVIGTDWAGEQIWLRRSFVLPKGQDPDRVSLLLHHDEDAEVYINGVLAAKVTGYTTAYDVVEISPEARATLGTKSPMVIAIRCRQNWGGQYIDAGLVEVEAEQP